MECKFIRACADWRKISGGRLPDNDSIETSHDVLCNSGLQYDCDLRDKYILKCLLNPLGFLKTVGEA